MVPTLDNPLDNISDNTDSALRNTSEEPLVFIGCLGWQTTESDIETYFKRKGHLLKSVLIVRDKARNNVSKGYGFITFNHSSGTAFALESIQKHNIAGRIATCKLQSSEIQISNKKKLFVGGIPLNAKEQDLIDAFQNYEVIQCSIMRYPESGKSRGFGFVSVPENTSIQSLLDHTAPIRLFGKVLEVKIAQPRKSNKEKKNDKSSIIVNQLVLKDQPVKNEAVLHLNKPNQSELLIVQESTPSSSTEKFLERICVQHHNRSRSISDLEDTTTLEHKSRDEQSMNPPVDRSSDGNENLLSDFKSDELIKSRESRESTM